MNKAATSMVSTMPLIREHERTKSKMPTIFGIWLFGILFGSLIVRSYGYTEENLVLYVLFICLAWPLTLSISRNRLRGGLNAFLSDKKFLSFLFLYLCAIILSFLGNVFSMAAFGYTGAIVVCFILAYLFNYSMADEEISRGLILYSILAAGALIIYALVFDIEGTGRLGGILNPNSIGMISVSIILASLLNRQKRWLMIVTAIPILVVLYLANSRASIGGLCVGLVIFVILKYWKLPSFGISAFLCFAVCAAIPIAYYGRDTLTHLISGLFALDDRYRGLGTGATGRIDAWKEAWSIFMANPLFGVGYRMHEHKMHFHLSAHNGYLAVLADTGVLGFTITLYFVVISLRNHFKNHKEVFSMWATSAICAYLFISFYERFLFNTGNPMSVLIIVLLVRGYLITDVFYKQSIK